MYAFNYTVCYLQLLFPHRVPRALIDCNSHTPTKQSMNEHTVILRTQYTLEMEDRELNDGALARKYEKVAYAYALWAGNFLFS